MMEFFWLHRFEVDKLLEALLLTGAASVRILQESFRLSLLQEAQRYPYSPEAETVGCGDRLVRQQVQSCTALSGASHCLALRDAFEALVNERLADLNLFATDLHFNAMVLQKYERGSLGITPHKDRSSYINLICIFVLDGQGRFYVCSDRSGNSPREIDAAPGTVILLRAPGFMGLNDRPFHFVSDIRQTRYTLGLRQQAKSDRQ